MLTKENVTPVAGDGDTCDLEPDEILELIRVVEDPDVGISIVDLGLIYEVKNDHGNVNVDMTLTSPSCPYGPQLVAEVNYILNSIPGVRTTNVEVVWDPPWSLDNVSEAVKLELGMDL
ncbi:MAG: iron-sulfur cluster assembly protein [Lentisphaeria bacterium]|jgi:metal-sulfur cluster biosynthetic enzyme|nr:iron-sulfur cluster assembly protein [Lentisphaeria bacterium]MDP7742343.1 iron-sulfur cluster assembly protein [Lentisphaeria bacterium]|tara:strand:+ start:228 stop:581 length:354 start_codon:yes stop_codon:yes gene_type:complete